MPQPAATGLLALSDQLAELRDLDVERATDAQALNAGTGEKTRVDRALLTARSGRSSKASRTREEVELVFDRNKSAIYALYARALRDNPALQGKVVLEFTIAPSGEVTDCRVVSSDLADAELERKLVARVKMIRFEARQSVCQATSANSARPRPGK